MDDLQRSGFDRQMALEALLVEYRSLRDESLAAIAHRIQIVNFTFGAIAIILGGLSASRIGSASVALVSLGPIPMLAYSAAFVWLGEHHRSKRAGRAMIAIEASINRVVGQPGLISWETGLARRPLADRSDVHKHRGRHMGYPYVASCASIFGAGFMSQVVGVMALIQWHPHGGLASAIFPTFGPRRVAEVVLVAGAAVLGDLEVVRRWRRIWVAVNAPEAARLAEGDFG